MKLLMIASTVFSFAVLIGYSAEAQATELDLVPANYPWWGWQVGLSGAPGSVGTSTAKDGGYASPGTAAQFISFGYYDTVTIAGGIYYFEGGGGGDGGAGYGVEPDFGPAQDGGHGGEGGEGGDGGGFSVFCHDLYVDGAAYFNVNGGQGGYGGAGGFAYADCIEENGNAHGGNGGKGNRCGYPGFIHIEYCNIHYAANASLNVRTYSPGGDGGDGGEVLSHDGLALGPDHGGLGGDGGAGYPEGQGGQGGAYVPNCESENTWALDGEHGGLEAFWGGLFLVGNCGDSVPDTSTHARTITGFESGYSTSELMFGLGDHAFQTNTTGSGYVDRWWKFTPDSGTAWRVETNCDVSHALAIYKTGSLTSVGYTSVVSANTPTDVTFTADGSDYYVLAEAANQLSTTTITILPLDGTSCETAKPKELTSNSNWWGRAEDELQWIEVTVPPSTWVTLDLLGSNGMTIYDSCGVESEDQASEEHGNYHACLYGGSSGRTVLVYIDYSGYWEFWAYEGH